MEQQRRGSHLLFGTFLYYLVRLYETEKIDGYKFPVYSTQLCPKNETEWIKRSSDLNCTEHNGYMCLPDQDFTELLEFCYTEPKVRIQKGVCLFLVKEVSKVDSYDCRKFNDGCPISFYLSDKSFEHQACLSIGNGCFLAEPSCERPTSTIFQKTTEQMPTGDVPSDDTYYWVLAIIPVSIIFLYIFIVLFINNKKCSVCKRNNDEEQTTEKELELLLNVEQPNENRPTEEVLDEDRETHLNVTGSPPNITINLQTEYLTRAVKLIGNVFVYHGSPGIQRCYWTKNDKEIHGDTEESGRILLEGNFDNPSLTIKNVGPDDAGEYRLTARNDVGSRTSNVNVLGKPMVFVEKTENEKNGDQRITVTISAFPSPFHVQWITKSRYDENFTPIDINAKEYEGTTVDFPNPVLVVKQSDQLEKTCFKIEVSNFIGKTVQHIFGDENQVVPQKTEYVTIDSEYSLQDLLRCQDCDTPFPPLFCDICRVYLCNSCKESHCSDTYKEHMVVAFKDRSRPKCVTKCPQHSSKCCDYYCTDCDMPMCTNCVSDKEHINHTYVDVMEQLKNKKYILQEDVEELRIKIHPLYKEILSYFRLQKAKQNEHSKQLSSSINSHGKDSHTEINIAIEKLLSDLVKLKSKNCAVLNNWEYKVTQTICEIDKCIDQLDGLLISNDISLVSTYKSRNAEFKNVPPKVIVSLPTFTPQIIKGDQIHQQFGSLSGSTIVEEEHGFTVDYLSAGSCPMDRPLIDIPLIITDMETAFGPLLCNVSCLNDEKIWTCGFNDESMILYDLQGKTLNTIKTKSGKNPRDIAITKSEDLVYTDYWYRTVNIVKNEQTQELIILRNWVPCGVCSTLSGNLLVIMYNDYDERTKVVCYTDSTEKQSIQFNDFGKPLYSAGGYNKYISENRNQDICVSDYSAHAIVVVNKAGKLRFTYTGHHFAARGYFSPCGIATDSQSRILTSDIDNFCIYILDQNGGFLRSIDNCHLDCPSGICVDTKDNLFVAVIIKGTGVVRKIQYCMQ